MKKFKNVLLGLFALMLVVVPMALVGCGSAPVEIIDGAYYYADMQAMGGGYQVMQLNKEEKVLYTYTADVDTIEELIVMIENGDIQGEAGPEYTEEIIEGKVVLILDVYGINVTFTPSDDGKSIEYKGVGEGVPGGSIAYSFTLYEE